MGAEERADVPVKVQSSGKWLCVLTDSVGLLHEKKVIAKRTAIWNSMEFFILDVLGALYIGIDAKIRIYPMRMQNLSLIF